MVTCGKCNKVMTARAFSNYKHKNVCFLANKTYRCEACNLTYLREAMFVRHVAKHHKCDLSRTKVPREVRS